MITGSFQTDLVERLNQHIPLEVDLEVLEVVQGGVEVLEAEAGRLLAGVVYLHQSL